MFSTWLSRWKLVPDGAPIVTHTSYLLPVTTIHGGKKAILKLTDDDSERTGCQLMTWWNGKGAARVLAHENGAILLERATGTQSLTDMSREDQDARACRIICQTARRLHVAADTSTPVLTPLEHWFGDLEPTAQRFGGIMLRCAQAANVLFSTAQDVVVLHGDLHHGNVLDFAESGWLAIDPKGLLGERGFDYANIFTNPDLADPGIGIAIDPSRFTQRVNIVSEAAGLKRERLLLWIAAWCGLSSAWFLQDGGTAAITLHVAELAFAELDSGSLQF
ncbi:APH(6) family putative aminoglycoside O-phosphotransferase [Citrobacter werkmanii]|uniref:aminoglycoside phosphotransferase family protein n=1 Tax=Citrobacter sp. wls711 TaxID=2576425 RepID=UPI000BBD3239|nr:MULTISPECIES: aminoglycoside phosphotransferase family protein [Citrobacter]ATF49585.1 APH(6) family putative aminoglycoside O-phosphotransferase [Citrobacter werkmanii]TKU62144.1 APH(6) family putative aminoglycoside O-phosphotransferase [Citrobacter sp. wls711]HEE0119030.1 APH(6) family putative aminoglycoside O-phosphotransferase [Citrobacter gillenii]